MRYLMIFILLAGVSSSGGCGTLQDAMTPDIPSDIAVLHSQVSKLEKDTIKDLETRIFDFSAIKPGDDTLYFNRIQEIKNSLGRFAQWLRKSGLDDRLYEATVVRLRVWEDMQAFFSVQDR